MNKTMYVALFPTKTQQSIRKELEALDHLTQEDVENGMCSRLCDLEDTINISKYC